MKLEDELNSAQSPEEMRERLMAKVKADTAAIEATQRKTESVTAALPGLREQLKQKEGLLQDSSKVAEHAANYDKLVERDKKINEFLDSFPRDHQEAQVPPLTPSLIDFLFSGLAPSSLLLF